VQVDLVGRHSGEYLATHPERRHVEVRLLGGPGQRQREAPGLLNVAHRARLTSILRAADRPVLLPGIPEVWSHS
jgi:hypothetical protein